MKWLVLIAVLALGTYMLRVSGPLLGARLSLSPRTQALLTMAATVMLAALVATATLSSADSADNAISVARICGVAFACVLAWRRVSMTVVVVAAAGVTAGLRLLGIG